MAYARSFGGLISSINALYPRNDFSRSESHLQSASIASGDTPLSTMCEARSRTDSMTRGFTCAIALEWTFSNVLLG